MAESKVSSGTLRKRWSIALYLLAFFVVYFSVTGLASGLFMDSLISFTISLALFFSKLISLAASSEGNLLTISGFTLSIDPECTAHSLYAVFIAGVFAYPGYSLSYKLKGILYGVISMMLFNIFRIIAISVVGAHFSRDVFDFIHVYVFQTSFVVFVCFVWILWLKRDIFSSRPSAAFIGVAFIGTIGCLAVMWAVMEWYVGALTHAAGVVNSAIGRDLVISRYNDEIAFSYSGRLTGFRIYQHVFDSAIFFGLMLATAKGHAIDQVLRRTATGAAILAGVHLIIILLAGNLLAVGAEGTLMPAMDMALRGVSIAAPILLWFLLKKGFAKKVAAHRNIDENAASVH